MNINNTNFCMPFNSLAWKNIFHHCYSNNNLIVTEINRIENFPYLKEEIDLGADDLGYIELSDDSESTNCDKIVKLLENDITLQKLNLYSKSQELSIQNSSVRTGSKSAKDHSVIGENFDIDKPVNLRHPNRLDYLKCECINCNYKPLHNQELVLGVQETHASTVPSRNLQNCAKLETCQKKRSFQRGFENYSNFECIECKLTFFSKPELRHHMRRKHISLKCPKCGKNFIYFEYFRHRRIFCGNPVRFNCQYCDYNTKFRWYLKIHVFKRHGLKDFEQKEKLELNK